MEEKRIDMRIDSEENRAISAEVKRSSDLCFDINTTRPMTGESAALVRELFKGNIGENSRLTPPVHILMGDRISIGRNVVISYDITCMSVGGITIEDNVLIAAGVKILTNNHDPADRAVLTAKPVVIKRGAWVGAGATILPGVTVGENAVVAAGAVVTKDVEANTVVGGVPAKVIKTLNQDEQKE